MESTEQNSMVFSSFIAQLQVDLKFRQEDLNLGKSERQLFYNQQLSLISDKDMRNRHLIAISLVILFFQMNMANIK